MNASNGSTHSDTTFHKWKAEPTTRGSFSIISSCLITMTLCVWTSVHLNLPEYQKPMSQTWRKVMWLMIALLAPEFVAVTAYSQYKEAQELGIYMRGELGQPEPVPWWRRVLSFRLSLSSIIKSVAAAARATYDFFWGDCKRCEILPQSPYRHFHPCIQEKNQEETLYEKRHIWTASHSFYAIMGGFAISTEGMEQNFLPGNRRRMALTGEGFQWLAERDPTAIPDISEAEIQDKSKASNLAKTIVCLQASWFGVQCCTRWGQGLAVSLLELNTFGHAISALLVYLFWWDKPLDVERPSLLHGQNIQGLGQAMALNFYLNNGERKIFSRIFKRSAYAWFNEDENPAVYPSSEPGCISNETENEVGYIDLQPGHAMYGIKFEGYVSASKTYVQTFVRLSTHEVRCWRAAALASGGDISELIHGSRKLVDRISNAPLLDNLDGESGSLLSSSPFMLSFTLAGLCYGGLHLTAWNSSYRSITEELLWKISAIGIAAVGLLLHALGFSYDVYKWLKKEASPRPTSNASRPYSLWHVYMGFLLLVLGMFYVFARFYLVVESFLSLTHLPESAFLVPKWSQYFPHVA
ncbi:hypothetical protein DM02DRAFT_568364 [Periconia macrospinosa]|uniref:Uncharacterized protein n=1 Tax=Periconia macrospinosa TaxID=97972 RepID=A0A2V1DIS8_9PLEO|nr:hypothetical protein DM02DRAFT_568364 [Periconia macrospinosa]